MFHDPYTDVSEARCPTPAQREVLDLLDAVPAGGSIRLSLSDWRRVDRMADALAEARTGSAAVHTGVPGPAVRAA